MWIRTLYCVHFVPLMWGKSFTIRTRYSTFDFSHDFVKKMETYSNTNYIKSFIASSMSVRILAMWNLDTVDTSHFLVLSAI